MSDEKDIGLFEAIYHTRAMRRLESREVPEELLVKLIDAANQAPSGSNMQRARYIVVRDAEQREKLAALNKTAVEAYIGPQSGRAGELPHQSAEKRQRMLDSVIWQAENMQNIPALVIPCFEFDEPPSRGQAAAAGSSLWPGVQNLLLAARGLGLGAALTTLGLTDRDASREVLGLPDTIEAYAIIPVGYPTGKFGPVTRMPVDTILHWDRW